MLAAWRRGAARAGEELSSPARLTSSRAGRLPRRRPRRRPAGRGEYRALLRRARVFVMRAAPRGLRHRAARGARRRLHARETPAPGPYAALRVARAARRAPGRRGSGAARPHGARRPARRTTPRARSRRSRRSRTTAVDATSSPSELLPRLLEAVERAASSAQGRVFATSLGGQPGPPRGRDAPAHVRRASRCGERRSRSASSRRPRRRRARGRRRGRGGRGWR